MVLQNQKRTQPIEYCVILPVSVNSAIMWLDVV